MKTELEPFEPQWLSREYPVTIKYQRRTSRFYSLTDAEIEMYANTGWAANILLTLCGIFGGFALGCVVSLMQGSSSLASQAMLSASAVLSGIVGVLFLLLAAASFWFQRKVKRLWEIAVPTTASPEQGAISDTEKQART